MTERTLIAVSAGLSQPSSTRLLTDRLVAASREQLHRRDVRVDPQVIELRDHAHDLVNHMLTGFPSAALKHVIDTVTAADGLIAVTPIFNASYSGLFKSFFDVFDDESLVGMPVLAGATGGTARHSLALEYALRPMFTYLRAVVVPTAVFAAAEDWSGSGAQGALSGRIRQAAAELAEYLERGESRKVADPFELTTSFEQLLAGEETNGPR